MDEATKAILSYINTTPEVLSVLYDVDLLPEETMQDPGNWLRTVLVVKLFQRIHHLEDHTNLGSTVASLKDACERLYQRDARIAELERGEYICQKCGLRKDAAHSIADF